MADKLTIGSQTSMCDPMDKNEFFFFFNKIDFDYERKINFMFKFDNR